MGEPPRITIAIPFYRGLGYLQEAIESVLGQTSRRWQLLVCDDLGEEDPEAVERLLRELADSRIEYHRNPSNLGMVPNWNHCLELAEHDLVTLLHADDRLESVYVEEMIALAERHPEAAGLFCPARIIDALGRERFSLADAVKDVYVPTGEEDIELRGEASLSLIMAGNFIMCPTVCWRRSVLAGRRFQERWRQVQDLELTSRLLMDGESLVGGRTTAYAYRRHPENATSIQSASRLRFEEELAVFREVSERARELGWERAARIAGKARMVRLHLVYRALRDLFAFRPGRARHKLALLRRQPPD